MLRISNFLLLLTLFCGKMFANIDVELDIVSNDSVLQYRYLYVLQSVGAEGKEDVLAVFDSLSFNKHDRVSLFYTVSDPGKNVLTFIDADGQSLESNPFKVSPRRTVFLVIVDQEKITVSNKTYLHSLKNENKNSYYIFLLIFLTVKILLTAPFVFISNLRKRNIAIAAGAFLLSAFIDWLFPVGYLYRLLMTMFVEFLLIAVIGCRYISRVQAAVLVLIVNTIGFGIIMLLYLSYMFW